MAKLSLLARKNIKDAEEKIKNGDLKTINEAFGTEWTIEINYEELEEALAGTDYANRSGEVTEWYFRGLAHQLKRFAEKDEMYKEALVEEITANKIVGYKLVDEGSFYNKVEINDGALVLVVPKNKIAVNCDSIGGNLEELL